MPSGLVTVTGTVSPAVPAGDVTAHDVAEQLTPVAGVAPNCTDETSASPVPVNVTEVPPAVEPNVGATLDTVGGGGKVTVI